MHTPPMQRLGPPQRLPHAPQLARSEPSTQRQLQNSSPARQALAPRHRPAQQLCPAAHASPQPPQWFTSASRGCSHPLASAPSQSPKPAAHARRHAPAAHVAAMLGRVAQAVPHDPQLAALLARSTHAPAHAVAGAAQVSVAHAPATQACVEAHRTPHAPQWASSVPRSTQAREQLTVPVGHVDTQLPAEHAIEKKQLRPQVPQLDDSASVVHRPLQRLCPAGHGRTQPPATQRSSALHARPHCPQCAALVTRLTH